MPMLDDGPLPIVKSHSSSDAVEMLLTPSWLSGLVVVVAAAAIVLGYVGLIIYRSSNVRVLLQLHAEQAKTAASNYPTISSNLPANPILSDLPLAIIWAGVGLIVYSFVSSVFGSLRSAAELHSEMSYVHASRSQILKNAGYRLFFRAAALALWFLYLNLTVHLLVPYSVAVGYAGTSQGNWPAGALYMLGAVLLLAVCLHIHTVLLRLVALRPRLFDR